jgi:tryptophanyl-tRNA synthetase
MTDSGISNKPVILSGIQPSGKLHLGNLVGAVKNWVHFQDNYQCYYTIVDQHAITIPQDPATLRKQAMDLAALLIACGVDPERSVLFIQSHVPEHSQLAWILNCYASVGELNRMTQFKDKSAKQTDFINVGLFAYPVLQAADILLYQADLVPVGQDQKQHLELSRNIAERFNHHFPGTFTVPEPFIPKVGAKVMSLQDPYKKMSKSDTDEKGIIYITDGTDAEIRNKIKRAVTDSGEGIKHSADKPGLSNLITLYQVATGKTIKQIEKEFEGAGYGDFKVAVADAMVEFLSPIRERYNAVRQNGTYLKDVLSSGAEKARRTASKTLKKVYKKIGFVSF